MNVRLILGLAFLKNWYINFNETLHGVYDHTKKGFSKVWYNSIHKQKKITNKSEFFARRF